MIVVGIAAAAAIGMTLARRLVVEVPFVAFAVLLPIVGRAPRIEVGIVSLSHPGLWAAWNILAKGTLGVAVSALLTHTTSVVLARCSCVPTNGASASTWRCSRAVSPAASRPAVAATRRRRSVSALLPYRSSA